MLNISIIEIIFEIIYLKFNSTFPEANGLIGLASVITMTDDALAPCVARPSATMILTM